MDKRCIAMQGVVPPVQSALDLYNILLASGTDLRLPVGFENQLLADKELDSEVGKSMLQLLKVCQLNLCIYALIGQDVKWYLLVKTSRPASVYTVKG